MEAFNFTGRNKSTLCSHQLWLTTLMYLQETSNATDSHLQNKS